MLLSDLHVPARACSVIANASPCEIGQGRTDADAASVRSNHPIPSECGIYYFEIEIISRGREGYIGIGLSAQGVSLNRLPGTVFQSDHAHTLPQLWGE
jgi:hypothetical protein